MTFHSRTTISVLLTTACLSAHAAEWQARPDWSELFGAGVDGTIVVVDERTHFRYEYRPERAAERFSPASTFKVPHTLFALDAGLVNDELQVFTWDGERRTISSWNRDQTLRTAMRDSAVWLYQAFARDIGEQVAREYLEAIEYGNAESSASVDRFWLDGTLLISAREQVELLVRLDRNELPFSVAHQRLVKDLMLVETRPDTILRAKTGWQAQAQVGWWVGWVERPEGAVFFALNIDMPNGAADLPKRESIARAVLTSIGAL